MKTRPLAGKSDRNGRRAGPRVSRLGGRWTPRRAGAAYRNCASKTARNAAACRASRFKATNRRVGIGHVVLSPPCERFHMGRRDQLQVGAEVADRPTPMLRAGAGLHGHHARRPGRHELRQPRQRWRLAKDRRPVSSSAMRPKHVSGQTQMICHGGGASTPTTMAGQCRRRLPRAVAYVMD